MCMCVVYGCGFDEDNDGYFNEFGYVEGLKMLFDGFFVVGEWYVGVYGDLFKMDGFLDENKNVCEWRIVIYGVRYMVLE